MSDVKAPRLKLLTVIVDDERATKVTELFRKARVSLLYHARAYGTASSEILDVLGLGRGEKAVIFALGASQSVQGLLKLVARELRLLAPGRGIAFTMSLSGVSNALFRFLPEQDLAQTGGQTESEVAKMADKTVFDLIMAVVNRGYSDELMDEARAAGATGGTMIHAHRVAGMQPQSFWGMSLQEEKDMVLIVSSRDKKLDIMRAITAKCGANTEAQGFVFSLPVDAVAGLEMLEE